MNEHSLSRGLALFSLGLGLTELLAPRQLARLIGIDEGHERLLQAFGAREIASGVGILQGNAQYFLWSRVAGDMMDLAMLEAARRSPRTDERRVAVAMAAVAGVTVLDVIASVLHTRDAVEPEWRVARPGGYEAGIFIESSPVLPAQVEQPTAGFLPAPEPRDGEARNDAIEAAASLPA